MIRAQEALQNEIGPSSLGPKSRMFCDCFESNYRRALEIVGKLNGAEADSLTLDRPLTPFATFELRFDYRGHEFLMEGAAEGGFEDGLFVQNADCPEDILIEVIEHFDRCEYPPPMSTGKWMGVILVALAVLITVLTTIVWLILPEHPKMR